MDKDISPEVYLKIEDKARDILELYKLRYKYSTQGSNGMTPDEEIRMRELGNKYDIMDLIEILSGYISLLQDALANALDEIKRLTKKKDHSLPSSDEKS